MDSWVRFSSQSQAKERVFSYFTHLSLARLCDKHNAFQGSTSSGQWPYEEVKPQKYVCGSPTSCKAAQYACTLLGYTLQKNGASNELVASIKQLEAHLSLGRKLFRLGNSTDAIESAKRAIHLSDVVLRFCITVSHLNRAMYFACDNILWAGKTGLSRDMDQDKWSQRSFRYYLFSLIMNLSRDLYEIKLLMEVETSGKHSRLNVENEAVLPGDDPPYHALQTQLYLILNILRNNPPVLLDVLKNTCDIFIPLDKLGLYKTNPGFIGLCGLTSSILSILTIVYPWLKLKP